MKKYNIEEYQITINGNKQYVYLKKDIVPLLHEVSNILFSFESVLDLKEGKRIVRSDIKRLQKLRKQGLIGSKYLR